jgi:hypothetical protein
LPDIHHDLVIRHFICRFNPDDASMEIRMLKLFIDSSFTPMEIGISFSNSDDARFNAAPSLYLVCMLLIESMKQTDPSAFRYAGSPSFIPEGILF